MCGISGIWSQSQCDFEKLSNYSSIMANSLANRGPDSSGKWSDLESGIIISHKRLSIIDLSESGSQPMLSKNKNLILSFNGEIYNHEKIKRELDLNQWEGTSDTEILLAAIQQWGLEKSLDKCYGMFALALWNREERKLILARDRFGEKPLYWGYIKLKDIQRPVFVFTSDLSSLWSIPNLEKKINNNAFADFIKYSFISAPHSIQEDIFQLQPGHLVQIKSNDGYAPKLLPKTTLWWDIKKVSLNLFDKQNENQTALLENTLREVLKEQSKSDVANATFLSGGIDSSLITSLLQTQSSQRIKSYNISFPEKGFGEEKFNEGLYAKKIANFLGTDHTEIDLSWQEVNSIIPDLQDIYSEPFADPSQVATFLICQQIRSKGIKVAFGGDGADELFGGYSRYTYIPDIYNKFQVFPKPIKNIFAELTNLIPFNRGGISQEQKRKFKSALINSDKIDQLYDSVISNNANIHKFINKNISYLLKQKNCEHCFAPTIQENIMLADTLDYLPNNILVKLDRASMHVGLETRSPFLDVRISKIAMSTKLQNKIRNFKNRKESKYILKEILFKTIPKEFFNRPKKGFDLPIASWLRGPLRNWANDLLNPELINRQGYLSNFYIQNIWSAHLKGDFKNTELIWTILMWQSWITKWEQNN